MPLSEYEDRMLAQIESGLRAQDPKFASRFRRAKPPARIGVHIQGAALFTLGLTVLIAGLAFRATTIGGFPILSVFGYLMMWGGAVHLVTESVIAGAIRMAARAARWAREDPGRRSV
jgi:hypothetical protein